MGGEESYPEVEYLLQDTQGGETPRVEVHGEEVFQFMVGIISDLAGDVDSDQTLFPPEMYESEDRDLMEGQYLQRTPLYFFDEDEEHVLRVQQRDEELQATLMQRTQENSKT